jgi:hypothetical protein
MSAALWEKGTDPGPMLDWLLRRGGAGDRKLRLFACACVRRAWSLLPDARARSAVKMSEIFADGLCGGMKWWRVVRRESIRQDHPVAPAICRLLSWDAAAAARETAGAVAALLGAQEPGVQASLLRDLWRVGGRTVVVNPAWRAANEGAALHLARGMYEERNFNRMMILADALEEAGCDEEELLRHLRESAVHARGCWALDLILSKDR